MSGDTGKKKKLFIKAYVKHNTNISKACKDSGIGRNSYYNWVEDDDEFVKDLQNAWEDYLDSWEDAIGKSGKGHIVTTTEEKVTYQGEKIECKKETYYPPNPTSLKLFAEAKMRHRGYGRKQSEDKGSGGEEEVKFSDED